jgi:hypothetical protein
MIQIQTYLWEWHWECVEFGIEDMISSDFYVFKWISFMMNVSEA